MDVMEEQLRKDPTLFSKWQAEGEKQYQLYLQRKASLRTAGAQSSVIIIPVVFHLIDSAQVLAGITDRDLYEQIEILNKDYAGEKADFYRNVIPSQIANLIGRVSFKFVLARRAPNGTLTSGIERRVNTTPDHISIKSYAGGGLDEWDTSRYLNVWAGTFTGSDDGLLGIATFPFTTGQGGQGVVINISTLPYTSPTSRSYYPEYDEAATLSHEIGHYFYLFHTFGDETVCNNVDFRLQAGWPLPAGDGTEGDDTPPQQEGPGDAYFGNPSLNYSDGCSDPSYGIVYGSFMNYYDDRALFMFTGGMKKRMEDCINLYRPGLLTTNGATPPLPVTDAFMVNVTPRGIPEKRAFIVNNSAFTAQVRNEGNTILTSVTVNVQLDGGVANSTMFPLLLSPGADTILQLANINALAGKHTLKVYTSSPNNVSDTFTNNDTLYSYIYIQTGTASLPFTESFSGTTFPPAGWQIWNPNNNITWTQDAVSGHQAAGSATVQNVSYDGPGQLDDLITPAIDLGGVDSVNLTFSVAYAVPDITDVPLWDGLEVYVSGDGGITYHFVYKKTGNQLKTNPPALSTPFSATPAQQSLWRTEQINVSPYIVPGMPMIIKFRNTCAHGNNLYIDDVSLKSLAIANRDVSPVSIAGVATINCTGNISPTVSFTSNGLDTIHSLTLNYKIDNSSSDSILWNGTLIRNQVIQFPLGAISGIASGTHTLTIYTSNPNGLADQVPANDTVKQVFSVPAIVDAPVFEGFEETAFPPANWIVDNPDASLTWERTTAAAKSGAASMVIRNYDYLGTNNVDRFISPIVKYNASVDSFFVSFDYAYSQGINSSSSGLPLDTLELQLTTDCGNTVTTLWKKWGEDLQTTGDSVSSITSRFIPKSNQWKSANIYLSPLIGTQNFQVYFVAKSNNQNNLYIDNIDIYTKTVPALVKSQGYLIYPNPFTSTVLIRNYRVPTSLQNIFIYNSIGQLVWKDALNGTGITEMTVNLSKFPSGMYIVKMQYTEKTVVEKIIKQ